MTKKLPPEESPVFIVGPSGSFVSIPYDQVPRLMPDLEKVVSLSSPEFNSRAIFVVMDSDNTISEYVVKRWEKKGSASIQLPDEVYTLAQLREA